LELAADGWLSDPERGFTMKLRMVPSPGSDLLRLLFEMLSVELLAIDGASWKAESFGGTRFVLTQEGADRFLFEISPNPDHPAFEAEARQAWNVNDVPRFLKEYLPKHGVRCEDAE
jgi:hypothetical protein